MIDQVRHQWDVRRLNAELYPEGKKWCGRCKTVKTHAEFSKNARQLYGLAASCRACVNAQHDVVAKSRYARLRNYGITHAEYERMLAAQGGGCAICGKPPTKNPRAMTDKAPLLTVDHDHQSGAIRALLCRECNAGLGHFGDDLSLLRQAVAYLEAHTIR